MRTRMTNSLVEKIISFGFHSRGMLLGLLLFLVANFIDFQYRFDGLCMDCNNDFGWPIRIYESGGLMSTSKLIWGNIIIDLFLFCISGVFLSYVTRRIRHAITMR